LQEDGRISAEISNANFQLCCDVFYNIIYIWDVMQCRPVDYYRHLGATLGYSTVKTDSMFLRNIGNDLPDHMVSYPSR
jgi:hypothetical protein